MKGAIVAMLIFTMFSCEKEKEISKLELGRYRATLEMKDSEELPFNFEVVSGNKLLIFNAEEIIEVDEIEYKNDSIYVKMPVFEGYIAAKISDNKILHGSFVKQSLSRVVPFQAVTHDNKRFNITSGANTDISGNWETVFSPDSEEDKYIAKGIFKQNGQKVTGTFRTTTGDYRYLEGVLNGDELKLSTFDGSHAFLFTAKVTDSTMNGMFYSGNHWKEPFRGIRNETYELPDATELTYLKDGYDKIEFSFPDIDGNLISLEDERFKNKVVLIQIMGTWCPNCLDETKYFSAFYNNLKNDDFEIIALAFEYAKTEEGAFRNIKRLQEKIGINYPILLAQYGSSNKTKAQEKLPMLNHVLSYPTTIFIDKRGVVRKIHTGFNGPATGEKFVEFKETFNAFINELLAENN